MRVLTIRDVEELGVDEIIPAVRGQIKKVFDYTSGTNNHGPWSFQNLILKQGGSEIKVKLKLQSKFDSSWEGANIIIMCKEGNRGLTGVKRAVDDYKGANKPMIMVTETGIIEEDKADQGGDEGPAEQPQARQRSNQPPTETRQRQEPARQRETQPEQPARQRESQQEQRPSRSDPPNNPPANRPPPPTPGSQEDQMECYRNARVLAGKMATALCLGFDAAVLVGKHVEAKHGVKLGAEQLEKLAVSVMISLDRADKVGGLPVDAIKADRTENQK